MILGVAAKHPGARIFSPRRRSQEKVVQKVVQKFEAPKIRDRIRDSDFLL
jgi:hypothetical protein